MLRRSIVDTASKQYRIKRVEYPWLRYMRSQSWQAMHAQMIEFFRIRNLPKHRSSTVSITARSWPKFASKEQLISEGLVPAIVWKHGEERRIVFEKKEIDPIAFDDVGENSHISNLFKARLLKIAVDDTWEENCVVSDVSSHVTNRELFFIKLARHVPDKVTEVNLPISLTGLLACPATLQGAQIDLAMSSVKVECIGDDIPPPILVDVSNMRFIPPYSKITLGHIESLLPKDGKTRLSREYSWKDKKAKEVVLCYELKGLEERPLPDDYQDPNFFNRKGKKYHVTYSGFWPRQN